jgi:formylglycine-generating enzyme required for sulfatase activity
LPERHIRRLAVLGEPGAGKSFSLERFACDYARRALHDPAAPIPLLVRLGLWTREVDLLVYLESQLGELGRYVDALRDQQRAVLLLDGLNEIPPSQRVLKTAQVRKIAEDERYRAVLVSCRERDFDADYRLPFDTLTLQPLSPAQIHRFLQRAYTLQHGPQAGAVEADQRFWQIAGGEALREVWQVWEAAGASFEQFWTADEVPDKNPNVSVNITWQHDELWRAARGEKRSLLRLAANPYLLHIMMSLPQIPPNRAQLFDGFLQVLHERERVARVARHDARSVPDPQHWQAVLTTLAEAMQQVQPARDAPIDTDAPAATATSLAQSAWPASLTPELLNFSIDASVLQRVGNDVRFTHQLLQEALASRVLRETSESGAREAQHFWPAGRWWQRNGWEVVAEIAAEACVGDDAALWRLIRWLAQAQPEVACDAWQRAGAPALPPALAAEITRHWLPRLTDDKPEPSPAARAAIGRALAGSDLDHRRGVGVRADGLPDIDWVFISGKRPFTYQKGEKGSAVKLTLPDFEIARYPITNRQFQAFVDAGGYADERWWVGLAQRIETPDEPSWKDPNAPRETVSWYEAVAFCRWLGHALHGDEGAIQLPTEQQWERAARGVDGREYPWGEGYRAGHANCNESSRDIDGGTYVGRTTAVGIYPYPSLDGVHDLAGNVWEWCLNEYAKPARTDIGGGASRVLRGGSWGDFAMFLRAAFCHGGHAGDRDGNIGFRVCRGSPIEPPATGALAAESLDR